MLWGKYWQSCALRSLIFFFKSFWDTQQAQLRGCEPDMAFREEMDAGGVRGSRLAKVIKNTSPNGENSDARVTRHKKKKNTPYWKAKQQES